MAKVNTLFLCGKPCWWNAYSGAPRKELGEREMGQRRDDVSLAVRCIIEAIQNHPLLETRLWMTSSQLLFKGSSQTLPALSMSQLRNSGLRWSAPGKEMWVALGREPHRRLLCLKLEKGPKGIQENANIICKMEPKWLLYVGDWEVSQQLSPYQLEKGRHEEAKDCRRE